MASFLADSPQSPLRLEVGDFLKIGDKLYKIGGLYISKLEYLGLLANATKPEDREKHPNRNIYTLTNFTINQVDAINDIISMVLENQF